MFTAVHWSIMVFSSHVCATSDYSSLEAKDDFYRNLFRLLRCLRSAAVVVVADGFNPNGDRMIYRPVFCPRRLSGKRWWAHRSLFPQQMASGKQTFVIKAILIYLVSSFDFEGLNSGWPHSHCLPVERINRRISITLIFTLGFESCFDQCLLLFALNFWSHQHENHLSCTTVIIRRLPTWVPVSAHCNLRHNRKVVSKWTAVG